MVASYFGRRRKLKDETEPIIAYETIKKACSVFVDRSEFAIN